MSTALVLGVLLGGGIALIVSSIGSRPAHLPTALRRLESTGRSVADGRPQGSARLPIALVARAARWTMGDLDADLAVLHRTAERHAVEKLGVAVALAALVPATAALVQLGGISVGVGFVVLGVLLMAALGVVLPDLTIRSQASARRDAFRHALSSYLDLVNVLLAGGAGVETALEAAAEAGDGWCMAEIRDALTRSRTTRTSPWECFDQLGRRLGVEELVELAASVQLAGQQGARIRLSLVAKASALRTRQMARIEADAQSATERMGLPTVLMFVGFLVLLGYPAVQMIVGGFDT